jgi:DNA-binding response OmpR family regulator
VPVSEKTPVRTYTVYAQRSGRWHEVERHVSVPEISSGRLGLTILGDSVIGQALVLLLRSSGYEVKFLPALPLGWPLSLKDSSFLLLTPTPQLSIKERQAFLGSLRNTPETVTIPVLELKVLAEETQEESAMRDGSWHYVPWPCRIEELEQCIEALISCHYGELEAKGLEALRAYTSEHDQQSLPSRRSASG